MINLTYGQEFEVYTGIVIPKASNSTMGYLIGLNTVTNLMQKDKYQPKDREYLNKLLIGIEYFGYQTKYYNEPTTTESTTTDCNCEYTSLSLNNSNMNINDDVTSVGLNFGIEIYKGWYATTGVTNIKHNIKSNNNSLFSYRETYINMGIKKFIRIGNTYFSPMVSGNTETINFGIGFSYD